MKTSRLLVLLLTVAALVLGPPASARTSRSAAVPAAQAAATCAGLFDDVFARPSAEPLAACQWDMAVIGADTATRARATGQGVTVGVLDSGVDLTHPDIAPNLDVARSCSFITADDPLAHPSEKADGDCSDKAATDDLAGHGTHVASIIASPVNGRGVAGVAPDATIVSLKACSISGYCFVDAVAAALRYAGDQRLDVVNMSLFADPYLYYCGNEAQQRSLLRTMQQAARYAQQRGVLLVAAAGNEAADLRHPVLDRISPDYPPGTAEERRVRNNCRVAPAELPGVVTVSATGPVGYPGYTTDIASYSTVGGDIAAPGGDWFTATGTVYDGVLAAMPRDSAIYQELEQFEEELPGATVVERGAGYASLLGTSMAAPHVAGVAALVRQRFPRLSPGAVAARLYRTAEDLDCPDGWEPLFPEDERERCTGNRGHTSFFGHGLVDADRATRR